ncbi:hypothetical protein [Cytobacillus oceanisediminis]|uniref:hypothetical protein n=1 Tax=Cytobacillus oceanisediminis TaxID=665099 RepID=UPI0037368B82
MTKGLENRVLVYSVSTDAFFGEMENKIAKRLMNLRVIKAELELIAAGKYSQNKKLNERLTRGTEGKDAKEIISKIDAKEKKFTKVLNKILEANKEDVRSLRRDSLFTTRKIDNKEINKSNNVVALFESTFTRTLKLSTENVNESVVIVRAYHYSVLESLITKGFQYNNEDYIFFSASSGQMKNKKCVFVKKDLWEKHQTSLMCGLTWDRINNTEFKKDDKVEYGVNINKFLAYLSLQNTHTTEWEKFDIDKVVVCKDLEMDVTGMVEFIDRDNYTLNPPEMKTLSMNVSDGVGLILPSLSKKNFQFRIPWGKGLLSPYDFRKHAELKGNYEITDVWGDTHHIINDDVQIILSASQLKTWKYYSSMEEYRRLFKENGCKAGKCNEEVKTNYINSNYQFIQSLDMDETELAEIATETNNDIRMIGSDKEVMLRSLGATEENEKKNYFQQALFLYPNLLNDTHTKDMIRNKKAAMVRDAKAGTLRLKGRRMFVLPDLHGYCEYLLTGNPNPKGLLADGEVYARDIEAGDVDLMRSPMLYREHGIATNVKNAELKKWYKTGAVYCSNHSFLARLLQMDFDGDQVNVCSQSNFVSIAKRNMLGVVPLYYEMSVAPIQTISKESIYTNLVKSFGSAIGSISNDITKIWNSFGEMTDEKLSTIKFLTMYNNFMIDFSKTNFLPKPKGDAKELIKKYTQGKLPYFFQYAKDKDRNEVEGITVCDYSKFTTKDGKVFKLIKSSKRIPVVNMLENIITTQRINFKSVAEEMEYTMLMSKTKIKEKETELNEAIVEAYIQANKTKKILVDKESEDYKENKFVYASKVIKDNIIDSAKKINNKVTESYVADVLVHHFHEVDKKGNQKTLWESFGQILLANLEKNLEEAPACEDCGVKFRKVKNKKRCDKCSQKAEREAAKNRKRKQRKK